MFKATFDRAIEEMYLELQKGFVARYGERAHDALHTALLSLYDNKAYRRVNLKGGKLKTFIKRAIMLTLGHQGRDYANFEGRTVELDEEQGIVPLAELITDVRVAIGKLSLEHQALVKAIFYDGATLREIASSSSQTYYHVFSEFEIAKACLRESLKDYAPRAYRIK